LTAPSPARAVRSAGAEGGAALHAGLLGADSAAGDSALARPVASPKASSSIHAVLARGAMLFDAAPALRRGSGDACSTESRAHQNTFDTSEQRPRRRISPTFGPLEPPADASHRLPRRVEPSNAGVGIRARAARGAADKAAASTTSSMRTRPNKRCAGTRTYSSADVFQRSHSEGQQYEHGPPTVRYSCLIRWVRGQRSDLRCLLLLTRFSTESPPGIPCTRPVHVLSWAPG
jgi:hypothetical protein